MSSPLSPLDFQVLLVLVEEPLYGYAIMKSVESQSGRPRKYYHLTAEGRTAVSEEARRLDEALRIARDLDLLADAGS